MTRKETSFTVVKKKMIGKMKRKNPLKEDHINDVEQLNLRLLLNNYLTEALLTHRDLLTNTALSIPFKQLP